VRKRSYFLIITLILSLGLKFSVQAQDQHAMLWKISGNGLSQPSYVFGIINFLPEDKFKISKPVRTAIHNCKVFVTKTPVNRASRKAFSTAARIPDNGWINDYLSDDELNQLRLLMLKDLQVSEDDYHFNYSRLQPVILVTATTLLYLGDNVVFEEDKLAKLAKKRHLKMRSLNTINEEINAFKKFPMNDQVEALKYTVKNFKEHINDYQHLVQYYMDDEDPQKIKDVVLKATNRSKAFQKVYYDERNEQ